MTTDGAFDLTAWTEVQRPRIEAVFEAHLAARPGIDDPGRLVEAMRYSLLAPGKRLRPLLALAAAEAVAADGGGRASEPDDPVLQAASAVELVHCYSLIHDDLPAMDNDDFRRGKPSNHKVYGEATAILAGDALLTLAFEWLADAGVRAGRPADFGRATLALARGAGMAGMVRGQARDLGEPAPATVADLERLHGEKTAALFRAATAVGAAAAGGDAAAVEAVGQFGYLFGIAFQHADDVEDGDHQGHAAEVKSRVAGLLAEAVAALPGSSGSDRPRALRAQAAALWARVAAPSESR